MRLKISIQEWDDGWVETDVWEGTITDKKFSTIMKTIENSGLKTEE